MKLYEYRLPGFDTDRQMNEYQREFIQWGEFVEKLGITVRFFF